MLAFITVIWNGEHDQDGDSVINVQVSHIELLEPLWSEISSWKGQGLLQFFLFQLENVKIYGNFGRTTKAAMVSM